MSELEGRTAVITGTSRGLGAGLAREFAARGMRLGLCSRSDPAMASSDTVIARRIDVRDEKSMDGFAREVWERFDGIDLWINNAGVLAPLAPVRNIAVEEFREHVDINLMGVLVGSQRYMARVRENGTGGVLINISSGAAWNGYAGWSAYCASKAGVALLSQCIAIEEAESGLRVHAVAPGLVDTEMQAMIRAASEEDFPMRQRFVEAKEADSFNSIPFIAEHILGLAFDPARHSDEVDIRIPDEKT